MMAGLAADHGEKNTVMIDAIYLKAQRIATRLGAKRVACTRSCTRFATARPSVEPVCDGWPGERCYRRKGGLERSA